MNGKIYLVDAGPGDPGLLTVKGLEVIKTANYIVYDHFVSPRLLSVARSDSKMISVKTFRTENLILDELIHEAIKGNVVCWLQSGVTDHSFFTQEQLQVLRDSGVSVEIVPGVNPIHASPVYAGIPLNPSSYTFVYGLDAEHKLDREALVGVNHPLFIQIWSHQIKIAIQGLIEAGYPSSSTGVLIIQGTTVDQQTRIGTLTQLLDQASVLSPYLSTVLFIGDIARERLTWFEQKPLFGRRILVTRARSQSSALIKRIEDLGGEPVEMPMIRTVMPSDLSQIDSVLQQVADFDWIVLTSVNGVEFFFQRLRDLRIDIRKIGKAKIAAVGPKTVEAIEAKGLQVDLIPSNYRAEELIEEMVPLVQPGQKILLPRGDLAREILPQELQRVGCKVVELDIYQTQLDTGDAEKIASYLEKGILDIITFASSSTVKNFVKVMRTVRPDFQTLLSTTKVACIGPVTADTAVEFGLTVDAVADPYTIDGLMNAVVQVAQQSSGGDTYEYLCSSSSTSCK